MHCDYAFITIYLMLHAESYRVFPVLYSNLYCTHSESVSVYSLIFICIHIDYSTLVLWNWYMSYVAIICGVRHGHGARCQYCKLGAEIPGARLYGRLRRWCPSSSTATVVLARSRTPLTSAEERLSHDIVCPLVCCKRSSCCKSICHLMNSCRYDRALS